VHDPLPAAGLARGLPGDCRLRPLVGCGARSRDGQIDGIVAFLPLNLTAVLRQLLFAHRPGREQILRGLFAHPLEQGVEHVEGFLLVLGQRVFLPVAAQADTLLERIHRVEVLLPQGVDDLEHQELAQAGHGLDAELGLAAGVARSFDRMLSPVIFLTYPVPKIVMLPLFMLWFGIGDLSKILIIALACFYPVFINAYYGVKSTPTILVWSALNMGADRWQIFRRVVVPGALPLIFSGLRVSLALSFIVMFATEMINSRSGLGHLIREAENSLRFDLMYVSLLSIGILGYAGDQLLRMARARLLAWQAQPA